MNYGIFRMKVTVPLREPLGNQEPLKELWFMFNSEIFPPLRKVPAQAFKRVRNFRTRDKMQNISKWSTAVSIQF